MTNAIILEDGANGYWLKQESFGLAGYLVTVRQIATNKLHCIDKGDADAFLAEYYDLKNDHLRVVNSRAARFTWPQLLDEICGVYFA